MFVLVREVRGKIHEKSKRLSVDKGFGGAFNLNFAEFAALHIEQAYAFFGNRGQTQKHIRFIGAAAAAFIGGKGAALYNDIFNRRFGQPGDKTG